MKRLILFACLCLLSTAAFAGTPRDMMVVSAEWLAKHVNDANLVLLHVGDKAGYEASHIPGARRVALQDVSNSDHSGKGLMLEMPNADELRQKLEALAISDDSRVIVYFGKDWVSPSTRILLTLDYAGLGDRASLLDGGLEAWKKNGGAVTADVPAAKTGKLSPLKLRTALITDADAVRAKLNGANTVIIDGRAPAFYDGVDTGGSHDEAHKTGHIAGARSVPYTSITDDNLFLKPAGELAELFTKAGAKKGDTIIGYCHIGQQATAMLFAAKSLGYNVALYDGSFEDWSRRNLAVDNPASKEKK
jgi:thiosulfate/3-mercaptopyruvate sulfurtransferase